MRTWLRSFSSKTPNDAFDAFLVGEPVHSILMLMVVDVGDGQANVRGAADGQEDDGTLSLRCRDPSEIVRCGYGDVDVCRCRGAGARLKVEAGDMLDIRSAGSCRRHDAGAFRRRAEAVVVGAMDSRWQVQRRGQQVHSLLLVLVAMCVGVRKSKSRGGTWVLVVFK